MKRKISKWISALLIATSIFTVGGMLKVNSQSANADVQTMVEYDFTSETQMDDFTAVYVATESGTGGTVGTYSDYFTLDTENGKVTSQRQNNGTGSTGSITSLVLNKYTFTNFEAEVVMSFEGDSSWGWGGLQFRKTLLNTGWRANGCFGFVQQEGHATIWGADAFDDAAKEVKSQGGFVKNDKFLLSVTVIERECTVTVSSLDKTTTYASVSHTFTKQQSVVDGHVALQSVDNSHNFYSLKITNLDKDGNEIALNETKNASITLDKTFTSVSMGIPAEIPYEVNGDLDKGTLAWTVSDPTKAIVSDGWITGLKQGEVTVSVSSMINPMMKDSITLTIGAAEEKTYTFDNDEDIAAMTPAYVAFKSDPNGGDETFDAHWTKTNDGTIKRANLTTSEANDENFAYLYDKSLAYTNFEATLVFRNSNSEFGWIGIASGTKMYNQRCLDQGLGCFLQREGYPTTWGGDISLYEVKGNAYDVEAWHTLRVRVYGRKIEMYIDSMQTPVLKRTCDKTFSEGYVGIMTTCKAQFEIASFTIKPLSTDGKVIDFSGIESISFANKPTAATVGDKCAVSVDIVGESESTLVYEFTSSDENVAFINGEYLYFISEGEVTVSVTCLGEARLTDSFTVTVSKKADGEKDYYYPEDSSTDDNDSNSDSGQDSSSVNSEVPTKNDGCGSVVSGMSAMVMLVSVAIGITAKRRKQQ